MFKRVIFHIYVIIITAMASKLHMLDESFRKFEMDDIGCQMLLSCEAAQLETMEHPIYGNLTPKIHKLLRYVRNWTKKTIHIYY